MTDDDNKVLETLVSDAFDASPTFSDEMMAKVREELLMVSREAEEFYRKEAAD